MILFQHANNLAYFATKFDDGRPFEAHKWHFEGVDMPTSSGSIGHTWRDPCGTWWGLVGALGGLGSRAWRRVTPRDFAWFSVIFRDFSISIYFSLLKIGSFVGTGCRRVIFRDGPWQLGNDHDGLWTVLFWDGWPLIFTSIDFENLWKMMLLLNLKPVVRFNTATNFGMHQLNPSNLGDLGLYEVMSRIGKHGSYPEYKDVVVLRCS